jgi:hypothetical protein
MYLLYLSVHDDRDVAAKHNIDLPRFLSTVSGKFSERT